jgi:FkbM family methyltransferase
MNTPRANSDPPMTKHLVDSGVFRGKRFCLVDVGASGGIGRHWEIFGESLRAYGFDGLIKEVERLNAAAGGRGVRYYPFLVGDKSYQQPRGVPDTQPFGRTSAARALEISHCNYAETYHDRGGSGEYTAEMVELDQFFLRDHPEDVDFIKIDTDGSDYQVLCGAKELLSTQQVLGLAVEIQFHGLVHDESNTFRNIDRLLTGLGFSIFDLDVHRYSRAALPKPFVCGIPAQTVDGQVLYGDALYLRDAGKEGYENDWGMTFPPDKIVKLACLFEIFGLEDCAAELLLKFRTSVGTSLDIDRCLDSLTPPVSGQKLSYRQYLRQFERNPSSFENSAAELILEAALREFQEIPGAMPLAKVRQAREGAHVEFTDGVVEVTTEPEAWYFAALVPFTEETTTRLSGASPIPAAMEVDMTVTAGEVSVGVLNRDYWQISGERLVRAASGQHRIRLSIPDIRDHIGLICRNGPLNGTVSRARISRAALLLPRG